MICFNICVTTESCLLLRFADEQMNMFRHDHVASNGASVPTPHSLQFLLEDLSRSGGVEQFHALVATEGDEVETTLVLIANGFAHQMKL